MQYEKMGENEAGLFKKIEVKYLKSIFQVETIISWDI